ncbi:uncharacterized protein LOC132179862 [Corylus avellana]|uniref:uncharacterized protein LOC132179862 n=1 Tax=Corylus avellana TaxID=13451 RepID=UPI00286A8055|nr:uncharacterized protein LOC132179862 [Corylus avellana]
MRFLFIKQKVCYIIDKERERPWVLVAKQVWQSSKKNVPPCLLDFGEMMYQCFTNTIPSSLTWDIMRMAGNTLHLLVILLAFSNLISLNAAPISRARNLLHDSKDIAASRSIRGAITKQSVEEELTNGGSDLESADYPGSGANHRHTPMPPAGIH